MKIKSKGLILIIAACVIALYNFILFLSTSGIEKTPTFWTSYAFIMFAFALVIGMIFLKNPFTGGTKLALTLPVVRTVYLYVAVEFVIGTLFMFLMKVASVKVALLVQVPVLILFVIAALVYFLGARHISNNYAVQKTQVMAQNMLHVQVTSLAASVGYPTVAAKLNVIADKIKFSDFNSYPELNDQDQAIRATVTLMKTTFEENELNSLAVKLERLVDERNELCKYIKKNRG